MSSASSRLPLRVLSDAIDAAVDHLARVAGLSSLNARVTLAQLNDTFDLFGVATPVPASQPALTTASPVTVEITTTKPEPAQKPAPQAKTTPTKRFDRGGLTDAILAALPGKASQIADKIGRPVTSVNSTLNRLREKGTVRRAGTKGAFVYTLVQPEAGNVPEDVLESPVPDVASSTPEEAAAEVAFQTAEDLEPTTFIDQALETSPEPPAAPQAPPETTVDDLFNEPEAPSQAPSQGNSQAPSDIPTEDTLDELTVPDLLEVETE